MMRVALLPEPLAGIWSLFDGEDIPPLRLLRRLPSVLGLGLLLCLSAGCASKSVSDSSRMTLEIDPAPTANQGKVFYMVVRTTNEQQFLTDTYARIADLVFADPPDPTILGAFPLFPDTRQQLTVVKPAQNPLAVYFLFTEPSDDWRFLIEQPLEDDYIVTIQGETVVIKKPESFWSRLFS